jgi:cation diffusion facilitator CzcD-associated flavoprotein CzcO
VILERADDVGGTWRDNSYPGAACDVPSHLYSFSFALNPTWSRTFSPQPEIFAYIKRVAGEYGIPEHVRYGHDVLSAHWEPADNRWRIETSRGTVTAQFLVSGAGPLADPALPDIKGIDTFEGRMFHSAQWDHDHDLTGRRVAVIGTGASAAQLIPHVAEQAAHLTVVQRTPNWFAPTPDYHEDVAEGMRWLLDRVGPYGPWYRVWLFWRMHEGLLPAAVVDPGWASEDGYDATRMIVPELRRQIEDVYDGPALYAVPMEHVFVALALRVATRENTEKALRTLGLDADVLNDQVMPAVDYRMPDGLTRDELATTLRTSTDSGRAIGINVTIFNPRLDDDGSIARTFVATLAQGLKPS